MPVTLDRRLTAAIRRMNCTVGNFGIIESTHELNLGMIDDYIDEAEYSRSSGQRSCDDLLRNGDAT